MRGRGNFFDSLIDIHHLEMSLEATVQRSALVCSCERAGGEVRERRGHHNFDGTGDPSVTASRTDQYWLTQYSRYMSVREVTRSLGIKYDSPLLLALQRVPCPTNAVLMLPKSINSTVATPTAILRRLDALAGVST